MEPLGQRARRTGMRTLGTAAVLSALLGLSACGSQTGSSAPEAASAPARAPWWRRPTWTGRAAVDRAARRERGRRLRATGCSPTVARGPTSAGWTSCPKQATVVHLQGAGAPELVLLSAKPHPRGGWQPHLFGSGGETGLTEVTSTAGRWCRSSRSWPSPGPGAQQTVSCPISRLISFRLRPRIAEQNFLVRRGPDQAVAGVSRRASAASAWPAATMMGCGSSGSV